MTKATVTGEYYTVATDVGSSACARGETREGHYDKISDAVEAAMRITLDRKVGCVVQRITTHEPVQTESWIFGDRTVTETVTGALTIPGPLSYNYSAELSRYHPVNGWVVPAEIDVPQEA